MIQSRLIKKETNLLKHYSYGIYNKFNGEEQWIRITEGCPNNCPFCYESTKLKVFGIPEIVRNQVKIMDMNLLCKPEALGIIKELGGKRVNGRVVYYELICGIDYRYLTQEIARHLKSSRFNHIRLAWDWTFKDQMKINDAIKMLVKVGFKRGDLMVFMICNYRIPYSECIKKLELCKYWGVKVADCYFDSQVMPGVIPIHWSAQEIKSFRRKVRRHNNLVNFGILPTRLLRRKWVIKP